MNNDIKESDMLSDQVRSLENKIDILIRLASKLTDKHISEFSISEKEMLTFKEAADYLGISCSLLYKLTSNLMIPHYKPRGKMLYFSRTELEDYMKTGKIEIFIPSKGGTKREE